MKRTLDFIKISASIKSELKLIEKSLEENYQSSVGLIPIVSEYLIGGGGKRIRPILLIFAAKLAGYSGSRIIPLACAIEYIHAATLLHDDVLDNAETRRKKTAANREFGNREAILVGDFLFSKAFELIAEDEDVRITQAVATASNELAEGEIQEIALTGNLDLSEEVYMEMIYRKTGSLICACCKIAGYLADLPQKDIEQLNSFGKNIGITFQLADDILDYTADQQEMGKPVGNDLREKKITLPIIYLLQQCSAEERVIVEEIIAKEEIKDEDIAKMKFLLERHDIFALCRNRANELKADALKAFSHFKDKPYYKELLNVAEFILQRTY